MLLEDGFCERTLGRILKRGRSSKGWTSSCAGIRVGVRNGEGRYTVVRRAGDRGEGGGMRRVLVRFRLGFRMHFHKTT